MFPVHYVLVRLSPSFSPVGAESLHNSRKAASLALGLIHSETNVLFLRKVDLQTHNMVSCNKNGNYDVTSMFILKTMQTTINCIFLVISGFYTV